MQGGEPGLVLTQRGDADHAAQGIDPAAGPERLRPTRSGVEVNSGVLVFPSYALFACALGITNGALLRRTIPAAAATLAAFLAVRVPVEFVARAHYRTPLTTTDPGQARGWIVSDLYAGPANGVVPPAP